MARSMTGYGRCELQQGECRFSVELKSVNNRYLDMNIRLPRALNPYEAQVRSLLKQFISRGKVDVYITMEEPAGAHARVCCNHALAGEYLEKMRELAEEYSLPLTIPAERLASFSDVLTIEEETAQEEDLWTPLEICVRQAAGQFLDARIREGAFITEDLLAKLDGMEKDVDVITANAPAAVEQYRAGLYEKMREILEDSRIDESRILQEAAVYADHVCVDEELVRLRSHIGAVRAELRREDGSVGRKLDFLAQEMNREANTILSKTANAESADIAIGLKTEIEKIREQIQNLE